MNIRKNILHNHVLAISIGIVYIWFGGLKFFPGLSPAEGLAKNTIDLLTFGYIPSDVSIVLLAVWETVIGVLFILNIYRRTAIIVTLTHLAFTFSPLLLFPEQSFNELPVGRTLLGQYILKNIIIVGALFTLYNQSPLLRKPIN